MSHRQQDVLIVGLNVPEVPLMVIHIVMDARVHVRASVATVVQVVQHRVHRLVRDVRRNVRQHAQVVENNARQQQHLDSLVYMWDAMNVQCIAR